MIYAYALPPMRKRKSQPADSNSSTTQKRICRPAVSNSSSAGANAQMGNAAAAAVPKWPFPAPLPTPTSDIDVIVSTDGSYYLLNGDPVAGWGFTCAVQGDRHLHDFAGFVACNPMAPHYVGAAKASNNTGELSAILYACRWIARRRPAACTLQYDSVYAANMARRIWRPSANFALVLETRAAVDAAESVSRISWQHIFGHTGDMLNERADSLAKFGAAGRPCSSDLDGLAGILASVGAAEGA
jgi:ribonuclease HI